MGQQGFRCPPARHDPIILGVLSAIYKHRLSDYLKSHPELEDDRDNF
jgi:hypothetical protein